MQARRPPQVDSLEAFSRAIVKENRVTNCIPNGRKPHAARPVQGEVQAARLAVPFENLFFELECSRQELASIIDDLLHALTEFFETHRFQGDPPPLSKTAPSHP